MGNIYGPSYREARAERMKFAGNRCETCKVKAEQYRLECHHASSYAYQLDRLNKLKMKDVIILCNQCHDAITDVTRRRRYAEGVESVQELQYSDERGIPTIAAQQSVRESAKSDEKENLCDNIKEKESRCGLRGNRQIGISIRIVPWEEGAADNSGFEPSPNVD